MVHEVTDSARAPGLNNTWPGRTSPTWTGYPSQLDSSLDSSPAEHAPRAARWIGWRLRLLVALALLGCIGAFLLIRAMADAPPLDAPWRADARLLRERAG